ncbi:hybrid sensor histidine kinase/response regulator [Noviherbaspirillum galbum]|uniref:histidine kinase n=1 Tax=Noviherbaspirillum galbum TaxID=2709383 RepID=A0A6B3SWU1_9BURK|nr:hybrid sensor histidine kinase/response regulator [Noviherbaspirillum galbum]NEX62209.1 hybrid sensor histidine kinase/response regulator [Noviherbaspirillum galbum]
MASLSGSAADSRLLRELFIPAIIAPVLLGLVLVSVVQTTGVFNDVGTTIWLFGWGLLIVLIIVMWRFAYHLHQTESAREVVEHERNEAMQALQLANERKNEFLAMLAHELRNPLAPISTAAELLGTAYASDPTQVRLAGEIISRQVNHMVHLVDDLLDVSRVTRGMIPLDKQIVDVRQIVGDAIEQVEPLIQMNGHSLTIDIPSFRVFVDGDHKRLVQVMANLLANAAKYTPENGQLAISMMRTEGKVTIKVQDNGLGIAPALVDEIFGLFIQAKRTPDRSQGGLGLGLALVKTLIDLHGGEVFAESEGVGKGSTFTIVLPEAVERHHSPAIQNKQLKPTHVCRALKVLIVDDNADAADTLGSMLRAEGLQVFVTYASNQALECACHENPDAYIIDIGLPDIDGYELARRLRKRQDGYSPMLVALTGYGSQFVRDNAIDAGFDHYFVKPAPVQKLIAVLGKA